MTFYVNKGSNHNLIITFDYSPERVRKIKQVTNRWNSLEKHWEIPATEQSISRFLSVLQDEEVNNVVRPVATEHFVEKEFKRVAGYIDITVANAGLNTVMKKKFEFVRRDLEGRLVSMFFKKP